MFPPTSLTDIHGAHVSIPDARAKWTHLQFRRFAGCPICNLHLQSFLRRSEEIAAAGVCTLGLVLAASHCGSPPDAASASNVAVAPAQGTLLLFPQAEPESLLGRAVTQSPNGGLVIADAREPGCEVVARHTASQYKSRRDVKTSLLASIGVGYQHLVSLEGKYGKDSQATLDLDNSEIIDADIRGACGDKVISRVYVGKGKRRVYAASTVAGGATAPTVSGVSVGAKGERASEDTDAIEWDSSQGYAFEVKELHKSESFDVTVRVPSILTEGDAVTVSIESTRAAYLIVLFVDSDGGTDVLWPSNEEPRPQATPDAPASPPSRAEQNAGIVIRAAIKGGKTRARAWSSMH